MIRGGKSSSTMSIPRCKLDACGERFIFFPFDRRRCGQREKDAGGFFSKEGSAEAIAGVRKEAY